MFLARGGRSLGPDASIAKERPVIIRSPHPPVPLSGLRLTEFILANAAEAGDKAAIIDGTDGRAISYRDLATAIASAAAGLARHGVRRGDVIALASPTCPEFAIAFHAALLAGAAVTPVSPLAPAAELTRQLTHSGARWMITTAAVLEEYGRMAAAAAGLGPLERCRSARCWATAQQRRPIPPRALMTWPTCPTRAAPPGCRKA
jgi:acyl-CoA synthetase (AMP-forming)/AMP-acid ligase II